MKLLEQARAFRKAFGQELLSNISNYGFIKKQLWSMQLRLISEEYAEFMQAADEVYADPENNKRREEMTKELSDLVFVCYQFAATYNIQLDEVMDRVFDSNMSKLGPDGTPMYRPDGKVLKGPNYKPPTLDHLFPTSKTSYDTSGK